MEKRHFVVDTDTATYEVTSICDLVKIVKMGNLQVTELILHRYALDMIVKELYSEHTIVKETE